MPVCVPPHPHSSHAHSCNSLGNHRIHLRFHSPVSSLRAARTIPEMVAHHPNTHGYTWLHTVTHGYTRFYMCAGAWHAGTRYTRSRGALERTYHAPSSTPPSILPQPAGLRSCLSSAEARLEGASSCVLGRLRLHAARRATPAATVGTLGGVRPLIKTRRSLPRQSVSTRLVNPQCVG